MAEEIIDTELGMIKTALDGLTNEVIPSSHGVSMLVHHIHGDPHKKLVLGSIGKGKSYLPKNSAVE